MRSKHILHVIIFLNSLITICGNIYHHPCSFFPRCRCSSEHPNNAVRADCSHIQLKRIPTVPSYVIRLILKYNLIDEIPNGIFSNNTILTEIDLSHNRIHRITEMSFNGLANLLKLSLQNNNLTKGNNSFGAKTFSQLKNLKYLNLKNNFVENYQPDISKLVSLKNLHIDFLSNGISFIDKQYSKLQNLTMLDLSGSSGKCSLPILNNESFQFISQVKHLDISTCKIQQIHKGALTTLKNITYLDVSNNTCIKFKGLENISSDLQFSNIKILKINYLHKISDLTTVLRTSHIKNLYNTTLQYAFADGNRVQSIEKNTLTYFPKSLKFLSVRRNPLKFGNYTVYVFSLTNLETVDVSDLYHHKSDLYPEKCMVDSICTCKEDSLNEPSYMDPSEISSLYTKDENRKRDIPDLLSLAEIQIPKNLKHINYSSASLIMDIPKLILSRSKLETVDFSNNILHSLIGPIYNVDSLKILNVSSNFCSNISKFFFSSDFKNLEHLNFHNNLLGIILPDDIDGEIFHNLESLIEIVLSNNRIPNLPENIFKSQRNLQKLDLSDNILTDITFRVSHMMHLQELDLSGNRITIISDPITYQWESLARKHNFSVDLTDNMMECNCISIKFIEWMKTTNVRLKNIKKYKCMLWNRTIIALHNPKETYILLKKHCTSYEHLEIVLVSGILLFIILIMGSLIFRYRWKLRYLYYIVKVKYSSLYSENEEEYSYMYGAFVSYADEDRTFVHNTLLQKLEVENGIQLCLHKRNFLPGNDIATNITSAIHNSRRTLVIMSHNFLKSYWCMFEYNMARMESIYERRNENVLFLMFYEQMPSSDLPLNVLEMIQSKSYIEYPNDEYGDTVFWDQLVNTLK
ncbi:toll-like receptor 4 [Mytilus californianus]|uniref:toll-like receptor 4 n=1 Tax=Mytilus californianus TaxID=6549 RepID=UPI0022455508|nr:toll-like receptor 4 [Mytilus californianus]